MCNDDDTCVCVCVYVCVVYSLTYGILLFQLTELQQGESEEGLPPPQVAVERIYRSIEYSTASHNVLLTAWRTAGGIRFTYGLQQNVFEIA